MTQLSLDGRRPNTAVISACGTYRYELRRELGGERPLVICGLNPSVADADRDDNTIRKDIGFAKLWGCGLLVKVNEEAYRATDPNDLKAARKAGFDTVGPENNSYLRAAFQLAQALSGIVLVAWGNHILPERQVEIAYLLDECDVVPMCLGANKNGTPVHELYQPYERELVAWDCP